MARTKIEQDLLDMLAAEKQRTATATTSTLPDIPPGLFGEEPARSRTKQASSPLSADAYMDFLKPPSPGRNVAEIDLDALWQTPPPMQVQAADDGLSSLWSTPAPTAPASAEPDLSALWGGPTASEGPEVEPELAGLWDTPGRSATAEDASESLSGLFMNFDARAQAEITGHGVELDVPLPPPTRTASTRGEFSIEFDSEMDFGGPVRPSGGASAPRYRIDRPPPLPSFNRNTVTAQDGVVVGQRGVDGRFQRTAAVRPAPAVSRSEAVARYEARQAASAPQAPRAEPTRYVAPTTKYDVLRKGGLDL